MITKNKPKIIDNLCLLKSIEVYVNSADCVIIIQGDQARDCSLITVEPGDLPTLIQYLTDVQTEIFARNAKSNTP